MLILSCTCRSFGCDLRVCFERVSMATAVLASEWMPPLVRLKL